MTGREGRCHLWDREDDRYEGRSGDSPLRAGKTDETCRNRNVARLDGDCPLKWSNGVPRIRLQYRILSLACRTRPIQAVREFLVLGTVAAIGGLSGASEQSQNPPVFEVHAVRFGTLRDCPVTNLVKGADPARKLDLAMTVWVPNCPDGRIILVDAGCYRPSLLKFYGMADFTRPDKALERLRIKPEDVTDIILTHMHSDHVDGADLFLKAQIWIQKDEYSHYAENATRLGGSPDPEYIVALRRLNAQGRVHLVQGDDQKIMPGITAYAGGRHTFASQYVSVNTRAGIMVIASDNIYLFENLEKHVPIEVTLDAKANLAAQDRMKQIAASPRLIIPGHDPDVFVRFPKSGDGVARLD